MSGASLLIIVLAVLLVFLLFKEISRRQKTRLALRIMSSVLVVASILWLSNLRERAPGDRRVAIVLTEGFSKDSLTAFQRQHPGAVIYCDAAMDAPLGAHKVADWKQLSREGTIDSFHVFGEGLSKSILDEINPHIIVWHAASSPFYISAVNWKRQLNAGEIIRVQGRLENPHGRKLRIKLDLFGFAMDSVNAFGEAAFDFDLQAVPLQRGPAICHLLVLDGKDTLAREPVPVEVLPPRNLQVLMLAASPDFENTYLKNYLAAIGYPVAMITTTSGDKQEKQFLNMQPVGNWTSPSFLRQFDVIISDEASLRKMSNAVTSTIFKLVREEGTGLFLKLDKQQGSISRQDFPLKSLATGPRSVALRLYGESHRQQFRVGSTDSVRIEIRPGIQPVLQDSAANIFASLKQEGQGRVLATTLQHSFSVALSGDKAGYSRLWASLLERVVRRNPGTSVLQFMPAIPHLEDPVLLQIERNMSTSDIPGLRKDSIGLQQNPLLPFLWQRIYWPSQKGWASAGDSVGSRWYVFDRNEWKSVDAFQRRKAMETYANRTSAGVQTELPKSKSSFLLIFLFLVLTAGCAFLWTEQKMV